MARLAEGLTLKQVAVELEISPNTVNRHVTNLMRKMDLHNRADLTRAAIRIGLAR